MAGLSKRSQREDLFAGGSCICWDVSKVLDTWGSIVDNLPDVSEE